MPKTCIAHRDPKLPPDIAIPEGDAWLSLPRSFSPELAQTLVSVAFTLCPHDDLPDEVYRRVVVHLDRVAAKDQGALTGITALVARLDSAEALPFTELAENSRVTLLQAAERDPATFPAFSFLQRATVRFLYDDLIVWEAFGYEGASVHLGGYADRGFNDLDWLPEPPVGV